MDDTSIQVIERLLHKKVILYKALLLCFKKERESLIDIDLDRLWRVSGEKDNIVSKIESIRGEIVSVFKLEPDQKTFKVYQVLHLNLIPRRMKPKFEKLVRMLFRLKYEIKALREENMALINESLQFLDEMISVITGETRSKVTYNDKSYVNRPPCHMFLSREA